MRSKTLLEWLQARTPDYAFGYIEWVMGTEWDEDQSTGQTVVLTRIGGPGLGTEGATDAIAYQVRAIGDQRDYDSAEVLADHIDSLLRAAHSQKIGDTWVTHMRRVGSPPIASMTDDSIRTHFVCSYVIDVGLAPPL